MKYLDKQGLNKLVDCVKSHIGNSIKDRYSQVVTEKNTLVTSKRNNSINEYTIKCLLNGDTIKAISLSEISSIEYQNTRKAIWTKTAEQGKCYAGIISVGSTAGAFVFLLSINNENTGKKESHYIYFIVDTPPNGTFLFCTTCEWNIEVRYNNNDLLAYLEVPSTFVGTISIKPIRCKINSGGGVYSFKYNTGNTFLNVIDYFGSDKIPYTDGKIVETELLDLYTYGKKLSSNNFKVPFGYHKTDIIYDFGSISVGDKISDTIINDCLIHDINKRIVSAIDKNKVSTILPELKIYNNKLYIIAPKGYINPDTDFLQFARYKRAKSRYVIGDTKIYRKKSGWITPRVERGDSRSLYNLVIFILNSVEISNITPIGYEAFLLGVSIHNEGSADHIQGCLDNAEDVAHMFGEANINPYIVSNGQCKMRFINRKCGVRVCRRLNNTEHPISDYMKFMVQATDSTNYPHILCRWR